MPPTGSRISVARPMLADCPGYPRIASQIAKKCAKKGGGNYVAHFVTERLPNEIKWLLTEASLGQRYPDSAAIAEVHRLQTFDL